MQLVRFFIIFKLHFRQKKISFQTIYYKKLNPFIKILLKFGLIQKIILKNNTILIIFNRSKNNFYITNLHLLYKTNNKKKVKLTTLNQMESTQFANVYIIFTSSGLLTNLQALKKHTGGIIFCRIS